MSAPRLLLRQQPCSCLPPQMNCTRLLRWKARKRRSRCVLASYLPCHVRRGLPLVPLQMSSTKVRESFRASGMSPGSAHACSGGCLSELGNLNSKTASDEARSPFLMCPRHAFWTLSAFRRPFCSIRTMVGLEATSTRAGLLVISYLVCCRVRQVCDGLCAGSLKPSLQEVRIVRRHNSILFGSIKSSTAGCAHGTRGGHMVRSALSCAFAA